MALTPKQQRFIDEYLVDLNGAQAAIRAGYSRRTANRIASENLSKPDIQAAVSAGQRTRAERTEVSADSVLREIAHIAFADIRDLFDECGELRSPRTFPDDLAAAVASIRRVVRIGEGEIGSIAIRMHNKLRALELLMKHLGMFRDPQTPAQWTLDAATLAKLSTEDLDRALMHAEQVQHILKPHSPAQRVRWRSSPQGTEPS